MKIGFIGCGNMATAMLKGILKSGEVKNGDMIASAKSDKTREKIEKELGIQKADTNAQVVDFADVVFLAVKPQFLEEVLDEIKDNVKEGQIFISIAPGKTLQWLGEHLGEGTKIIRTMPNTPAMVGEGMTALCVNDLVTEEETALAVKLCNTFGKSEVIPEHLMDAVVGVSGSSPAYVFMFLEAMADAMISVAATSLLFRIPFKMAVAIFPQPIKPIFMIISSLGENVVTHMIPVSTQKVKYYLIISFIL